MPKLGLGLSLPQTRVASASAIPTSGLSLWLKADAGLTTTPEQFISQIVLSDAGTPEVDGTYTRASGGETSFSSSNGLSLDYSEIVDGSLRFEVFFEGDAMYSIDILYDEIVQISILNGISPAPTASITLSPTGNILVTAWADQSGNGRDASPNEGTATFSTFSGKSFVNFPTYTNLAGYNAIWSETDLIVGTILIVVRFPSSGATSFLFAHDPSMVFLRSQPSNIVLTVDDIDNVTSSGTLSNNNTNYLIGATFDTNNLFLYLNGVSDGSATGQSQYGVAPYKIGGWENPSSIAEVVVYNRVLTTQERQQVEAYLNTKYAITLCSDVTASVLMEGWESGARTLARQSENLYDYGNETVFRANAQTAWSYANDGSPFVTSLTVAPFPWEASWPSPFTATKVCPA